MFIRLIHVLSGQPLIPGAKGFLDREKSETAKTAKKGRKEREERPFWHGRAQLTKRAGTLSSVLKEADGWASSGDVYMSASRPQRSVMDPSGQGLSEMARNLRPPRPRRKAAKVAKKDRKDVFGRV